MTEVCPVCKTSSEIQKAGSDGSLLFHIACPRCGQYQIEYVAKSYLNVDLDSTKAAVLSHAIRKMQKNSGTPSLDQPTIAGILQNTLPKPGEQMNSFVLWLGDNSPGLGEKIAIDWLAIQAEIGTRSREGVGIIVDHLVEKNLVEKTGTVSMSGGPGTLYITLKLGGWEFYENLKRGSIVSRKAFMAMQYGNKELDELVSKYFRPAVKATGFDLFRLDDAPKPGLIDSRLEVELRTSRFIIADLTHENRGAYWEAGFAQGLGKPVIYTCEKNKFSEQKTHFDTNHHTTVVWDSSNLEQAAIDLKNMIRKTFPEEAKMVDDK